LHCDLLIPVVLENQITCKNADKIKAKMVTEVANGPTTTEGENRILRKRNLRNLRRLSQQWRRNRQLLRTVPKPNSRTVATEKSQPKTQDK